MSKLKFILGVIIRSAIYIWLYIIIGLFSDFLLPEHGATAQQFYYVSTVALILAIFMTVMKYDQRTFARLITIKWTLPVITASLILIWIAICITWFNEIDGFQDVESFMFYEAVMAVLAFPSSIIGMVLRFTLFQILEIDTSSISELRQQLIILWLIYFVPFLLQLYLLARYIKRRTYQGA